ncbi:hypothetical protein C6A37_04630, partial [Desulfobacteraceae bacterium SEEP-SAG9]
NIFLTDGPNLLFDAFSEKFAYLHYPCVEIGQLKGVEVKGNFNKALRLNSRKIPDNSCRVSAHVSTRQNNFPNHCNI